MSCTLSCNKNYTLIKINKWRKYNYLRFILAPQTRLFFCKWVFGQLSAFTSQEPMLTNDAVSSRWFIYGWYTVPIVGGAKWLHSLTHLRHLASQPFHCRCSLEAISFVFNNILTCLDLSWTCLFYQRKIKCNLKRRNIHLSYWCLWKYLICA